MKFIGQFIQHFISRFKNDVYLEDVSTGTIASGGNLGLDSNNKIVKATIASGSGDITGVSITTDSGGGSKAEDTGGSADFSILGSSGVDVTNSGTTITATAVPGEIDHDSLLNFVAAEHYAWASDISGTATIHTNNITDLHGAGVDGAANQLLTDDGDGSVTSESALTFDGSNLSIVSASEAEPVLTLQTTHTTKNRSGELKFLKDAANSEDNERLGLISFYGENDAGSPESIKYAHIQGKTSDVSDSNEGGKLELAIASHDAGMVAGLTIVDGDANDEADVTIASGANSLTTISGDLSVTTGLILDSVDVTTIQTSAETFADNDTSLMTSAAIDDRILGGGSATTIKILPIDFMSNEDGGNNKSTLYDDSGTIGVRTSADDAELYAFVEIPTGRTARSVIVYGSDTSNAVDVFEANVNASGLTDKTPGGGCVVGTSCDMTDVAASATNYLAIRVTTTAAATDIVYGAVLTIA